MSRTILTIFGFTLPVSLIFPVVPTLGTTKFEFRTRFGISHRVSDADSAFVLRAEEQYQRVLIEDENANEFSFTIGFGARFGNNKASTFEVPYTQMRFHRCALDMDTEVEVLMRTKYRKENFK